MRIFCDVLGEHTFAFQLSLRWYVHMLTPRVLLICPIRGNECVSCSKRNSRTARATTQRVGITAHQHNQQPTTGNRQQPQQQTTTPLPPPQQSSTTNNKCTVTRTAITPVTATAATRSTEQQQQQLFHQAASQDALSPASVSAFAHKKSKAAATTAATLKLRHMESNSMETPLQRQMTHGPQSTSSGPEQQHACASHKNRGGPSVTTFLCANCFALCGFL